MFLLFDFAGWRDALMPHDMVDTIELIRMCLSFGLNFIVVWFICHFLYYPKGRRRDSYFTFILCLAYCATARRVCPFVR